MIGQGGFAEVYKGTINGQIFALKVINVLKIMASNEKDLELTKYIFKEIEVMSQFNHQNIL